MFQNAKPVSPLASNAYAILIGCNMAVKTAALIRMLKALVAIEAACKMESIYVFVNICLAREVVTGRGLNVLLPVSVEVSGKLLNSGTPDFSIFWLQFIAKKSIRLKTTEQVTVLLMRKTAVATSPVVLR